MMQQDLMKLKEVAEMMRCSEIYRILLTVE